MHHVAFGLVWIGSLIRRGKGDAIKGYKLNQLLNNAKTLRSNQTEAEKQLWYYLRAGRLSGLKFKRQKPYGQYIVDFICIEHRLIVELDGGQHAEQMDDDKKRDAYFQTEGYTVLRFWNNEVMQHMEAVLEKIQAACGVANELRPLPNPLQLTGEGVNLWESWSAPQLT